MKGFLITALFLATTTLIMGQQETAKSFEIQVSTDTILLGNFFEVRFLVQNAKGEFDPPAFEHFEVVGGPNQSSSMSIVNGVSSQSSSFSYFLKPKTTGLLSIEPSYWEAQDTTMETHPLDIVCLPNPNGIVEESRISNQDQTFQFGSFPFFGNRPTPQKKKKLKVTKI
jgi:hypothetical protein